MSLQDIIQAAIAKNPIAVKEAVESELKARIDVYLESKIDSLDEGKESS